MTDSAPHVAHIGVAVTDLDEAVRFYRDVLGLTPSSEENADGARIVSFPFGDTQIELLEPQATDGPVAKFIARRGPGIHHLCLRVADLDATLERCRRLGYRLVDDTPRAGVHGRRIAFLHPQSTAGILLELSE